MIKIRKKKRGVLIRAGGAEYFLEIDKQREAVLRDLRVS